MVAATSDVLSAATRLASAFSSRSARCSARCSRWSATASFAAATEVVTTPLTTSAVETGTSVPFPFAPWEAERSAFAWPRATDSSLARRDLNALRTREVTLFTNSTGALVTVSTASTAEATESVISFTSSRI